MYLRIVNKISQKTLSVYYYYILKVNFAVNEISITAKYSLYIKYG